VCLGKPHASGIFCYQQSPYNRLWNIPCPADARNFYWQAACITTALHSGSVIHSQHCAGSHPHHSPQKWPSLVARTECWTRSAAFVAHERRFASLCAHWSYRRARVRDSRHLRSLVCPQRRPHSFSYRPFPSITLAIRTSSQHRMLFAPSCGRERRPVRGGRCETRLGVSILNRDLDPGPRGSDERGISRCEADPSRSRLRSHPRTPAIPSQKPAPRTSQQLGRPAARGRQGMHGVLPILAML
jgi:hypothetical protein